MTWMTSTVNSKVTKKSLGRQISTLRQDFGLNQSELADRMGVSVRTVSGWETGDRPPKFGESLLIEIKVLEVPKEFLNDETKEDELIYKDLYMQELRSNNSLKEEIIGLLKENSYLKDSSPKKQTSLKKKLA